MKRLTSENQLIRRLKIGDLTRYLQRHGWSTTPSPNTDLLVFTGPKDDDNQPIQLVIPSQDSFADTPDRLADAINLLAAIEDKSPSNMAESILVPNQDVFRLRVLGEYSFLLPVNTVSNLIGGLRDLLVAGANNEVKKRPYVSQKFWIGQKYAQVCYFGHTFPGSFGFKVESPLTFEITTNETNPFGRRTLERILRGVHLAQTATQKQTSNVLIDNYEQGLNANMCNSLLSMFSKEFDIRIEYSVRWSPEFKASRDLLTQGPVQLSGEAIPYLERASDEMRAMEQFRPVTIEGYITQLRSEEPQLVPTDDESGTIVIRWYDDLLRRQINVHVPLPPTEYRSACDAHRDKKSIFIKGDLGKDGRYWQLSDYSDFRILG